MTAQRKDRLTNWRPGRTTATLSPVHGDDREVSVIVATDTHRPTRFAAQCVNCHHLLSPGSGHLYQITAEVPGKGGCRFWAVICSSCNAEDVEPETETTPEPQGAEETLFDPREEDQRANLEALSVKELKARLMAAGHSGAWIQGARKAQLVEALLTGNVPSEPIAAPTPTRAGGDAETALRALLASLQHAGVDEGAVRAIVKEEIAKDTKPIVEVQFGERPEKARLPEHAHPALVETLECLQAVGQVALVGPAGTGKTTLAKQAAEALGVRLLIQPCSAGVSEATLTGRMTAHGDFLATPVLDGIENGGVVLLDEADGLDPNAALSIHNVLSNGVLPVPLRVDNPVAKKHDRAFVILCMNTFGESYDGSYTARNRQDRAWLDRFAGLIVEVSYSEEVEDAIAESGNAKALLRKLRKIRANVQRHSLDRVVSMRALEHSIARKRVNPKLTDAQLVRNLLVGWSDEEQAKATEGVNN